MGSDLSFEDLTNRTISDYDYNIKSMNNEKLGDWYELESIPKDIASEYSKHITKVKEIEPFVVSVPASILPPYEYSADPVKSRLGFLVFFTFNRRISNMRGFKHLFFVKKIGEEVGNYKNCADRACFIIAVGKNFNQAKKNLKNIGKKISIETHD